MSQTQLARGCQFGNHGEPFLWHGSSIDEVDIAIMQLINLANDNPKLAMEAAEFVNACVHDAAQQSVQRMGLTEGEILRYWQHDETGYLCATAHRPSDRWHEITQEQYESDPRVSKLSTPHR